MTAPQGNQFWKARSSHGRRSISSDPETLWNACCEYFQWVDNSPIQEGRAFAYRGVVTHSSVAKMRAMTISSMCAFLNIGRRTWDGYQKRQDFVPVVTRVEDVIYQQKFEGAAADLLNANIIARDLGLRDRWNFSGADKSALVPVINPRLHRAAAAMAAVS